MSAFDLSSGSSFAINDSIEESEASMEFVEKRLNSMTHIEQPTKAIMNSFVNEQLDSALISPLNSAERDFINTKTPMTGTEMNSQSLTI